MGAAAYAHAEYAGALSEFGKPRLLPASEGWVLERPISGTNERDLMGAYPMFACANWSELATDLEQLTDSFVSVLLVADPLANAESAQLARAFPDRLVPLNHHLVRDLEAPATLNQHHRRHLRRASREVEVEVCREPLEYLDDWCRLYAGLVARHKLVGIRAFSPESFRRQLSVPGVHVLRASRHGMTVGMALWFVDAPNAYYHLGASSPEGYDVGASYAIFGLAMDHLRGVGVRWIDFGGGATSGAGGDGLVRFKSGWSNAERTAWLCGRILDRRSYARLERRRGASPDWFPAYRASEGDLAGTPTDAGRQVPAS